MVVNKGHVLSIEETKLDWHGGAYVSVIQPLGKLRSGDNLDFKLSLEFKASLGYRVLPCSKTKNKHQKQTNSNAKVSKLRGQKYSFQINCLCFCLIMQSLAQHTFIECCSCKARGCRMDDKETLGLHYYLFPSF